MSAREKKPPKASAKSPRASKNARPSPGSPAEKKAYVESVIATGEAACRDASGKLPPGATHEIVADEADGVKVVRRRFSAY